MADLFDLEGPDGQDNDGGFKTNMWLAPERDFQTIKKAKDASLPGAVVGDEVTIDGAHVFKAGKGWIKLYGTLDSGEIKLEAVGERDGRGQKGTIEFFHPGTKKQAAIFARRVKNTMCIVLVELLDGTILQLGSAGLGVEIVGSWTSGKVSGGRRGWTFKGEWFTNVQYFYEGEIVALSEAPVAP